MVVFEEDTLFSEECAYNLHEMLIEWWFASGGRPDQHAAPAVVVDDDDIKFERNHLLSDLECDECNDSFYAFPSILRKSIASKRKRTLRKSMSFVESQPGLGRPGTLGCESCNKILSHGTFKHSGILAYDPVEYRCCNCDLHFSELSDAARMRSVAYMEYQADYFEVEGAGTHGALAPFRTVCDRPTTKGCRGSGFVSRTRRVGLTPNESK